MGCDCIRTFTLCIPFQSKKRFGQTRAEAQAEAELKVQTTLIAFKSALEKAQRSYQLQQLKFDNVVVAYDHCYTSQVCNAAISIGGIFPFFTRDLAFAVLRIFHAMQVGFSRKAYECYA